MSSYRLKDRERSEIVKEREREKKRERECRTFFPLSTSDHYFGRTRPLQSRFIFSPSRGSSNKPTSADLANDNDDDDDHGVAAFPWQRDFCSGLVLSLRRWRGEAAAAKARVPTKKKPLQSRSRSQSNCNFRTG